MNCSGLLEQNSKERVSIITQKRDSSRVDLCMSLLTAASLLQIIEVVSCFLTINRMIQGRINCDQSVVLWDLGRKTLGRDSAFFVDQMITEAFECI